MQGEGANREDRRDFRASDRAPSGPQSATQKNPQYTNKLQYGAFCSTMREWNR
jgi:hypothetical protein